MKRILVSVMAVMLLAGCSQASPASGGPQSNHTTATEEAPVPSVTTADPNVPIAFGETRTYKDGLSVTVNPGRRYTLSEYTAPNQFKTHLRFTVTVINHTGKPYDATMFTSSAMSGTAAAVEEINGTTLMGGPTTPVLPGRTAKWDIAFGVANPKDVVLEATPGFEYQPTLFQN